MITKHNWLANNLSERTHNRLVDFKASVTPYTFKEMDFDSAIEMTVKEIASKYSNLYLGLSGGYDSDFLLRVFHKFNVPVTPIIVCYGTAIENEFAYTACKELGIHPIEINLTDEQFLNYVDEKIFQKFNSSGYNATHVMYAADYVNKHNGTLLTGNHVLGDGDELISDDNYANLNEWDFYLDYTHPQLDHIDVFLYTLELTYSMLPKQNGITWQEYKHRLFNLPYRDKAQGKYLPDVVLKMRQLLGTKEDYQHKHSADWSRNEWRELFKNYIEL